MISGLLVGVTILSIAIVFDVMMTMVGVRKHGIEAEANRIARYIYEKGESYFILSGVWPIIAMWFGLILFTYSSSINLMEDFVLGAILVFAAGIRFYGGLSWLVEV